MLFRTSDAWCVRRRVINEWSRFLILINVSSVGYMNVFTTISVGDAENLRD